ncbi:MAG: polyribonucleotide nucleotidyltransferase [Bacteroidia bacterium]|nr:polyribonucleotide nucleotidyltransferase [Bacteroidia bacterium]
MRVIEKKIELADGREITVETGKLAKQADGSVVVRMGDTMLLATVVSAREAGGDVDFMPLSVDYREKYAAAGKIPGSFFRREMRPSDYEVLISRLVDRALRPLFPDNYHAETVVTVTLISAEADVQPDALAGLAASAALSVSDIPFNGPISEVRVARIDGKFIINPGYAESQRADLDLMVGATLDNILMVEGEMNEVSEDVMIAAIQAAHEAIKAQCKAQLSLAEELGVTKRSYCHEVDDEEIRRAVRAYCYDKAYALAKSKLPKQEREAAFGRLHADFVSTLPEGRRDELKVMVARYYHAVEKEAMRRMILDEHVRLDGRRTDEVRPIWCEVGYLPCAHGSAIFTRGETQSLSTVTLGTKADEKLVDEALYSGSEQFMLHYNFPPFATGEAKSARTPGRREIGHGNLALRALKSQVPLGEDQPYCIRVVSDILESNGSSSMATVCAGTLALMDAGVQMRKPVSGIAMGLISDAETGKFAVLSDILGDEDHLGDMDFKVTGTRDGITATQMDIKVDGLPYEVLKRALEQAREGRMHILGKMLEVLPAPRGDFKASVPRCEQIFIPRDMIGPVIGPGGKVIQEMQRTSGAQINIEEKEDKGVVTIYAPSKESMDLAKSKIRAIVAMPEVGEVYRGKVKSILPFGAFVEILPGKDGLLHVSELDWKRVEHVEEYLKVGDEVEVKLLEIDQKTGKLRLSRKALLPKPEGKESKK